MFIGTLIGWLIVGLIVGLLARAIVPGRQDIGVGLTIVLGIVGAIVGGFLASFLFGPTLVFDGTGTYAVETAWPGWIMAVIGGALVLWLVAAAAGRSANRLP